MIGIIAITAVMPKKTYRLSGAGKTKVIVINIIYTTNFR